MLFTCLRYYLNVPPIPGPPQTDKMGLYQFPQTRSRPRAWNGGLFLRVARERSPPFQGGRASRARRAPLPGGSWAGLLYTRPGPVYIHLYTPVYQTNFGRSPNKFGWRPYTRENIHVYITTLVSSRPRRATYYASQCRWPLTKHPRDARRN